MTTLTRDQIIAKAARLLGDIKFYDDYNEAQRAAVNEICLSTSLTEDRALALWDVVDPVGGAIADDMASQDGALRFKQGVNADGGVTLTRVQQVAQYTGLHMALEAMRQTGNKVAVTVEIVPFGDRALNYIVTNDEGESVKLECSSTSFERLAQMAALLSK